MLLSTYGPLLLATGLIVAIVLAAAFCAVAIRPESSWYFLIGSAILAAGLMPFGYTFVDEVLLVVLLLGAAGAAAIGARRASAGPVVTEPNRLLMRLHLGSFLLLVGYSFASAAAGMLQLESGRKIRWLVFFVGLGLAAVTLYSGRRFVPRLKVADRFITLVFAAYLLAYLGDGLSRELLGGSRFDSQRLWWGTTAYSMFPLAVATPAMFGMARRERGVWRAAALFTLLLAVLGSLFYDSRIGVVAVVFAGVALLPGRDFGRRGLLVLALSVAIAAVGGLLWSKRDYSASLLEFTKGFQTLTASDDESGARGDLDRIVHFRAAFKDAGEDWSSFIFGHGYRTHGTVVSRRMVELFVELGAPDFAVGVRADESTEGFTALVLDTGVVGLLLLLLNLLFMCYGAVLSDADGRGLMVASVGVILLLWLVVINMLDITLFYFALMPNGAITGPLYAEQVAVAASSARDR